MLDQIVDYEIDGIKKFSLFLKIRHMAANSIYDTKIKSYLEILYLYSEGSKINIGNN